MKSGYNKVLVKDVIGTDDPERIYESLEAYVSSCFNSRIAAIPLLEASVGISIGLRLENKERIFVKILGNKEKEDHLKSINGVLRFLRSNKYPCPEPLSGVHPFLGGLATAQSYEDDGVSLDSHDKGIFSLQAKYLSRLHELLGEYRDTEHIPLKIVEKDAPWGKPHNAFFDFDSTESGSEWIYEKGMDTKKVIAREAAGKIILSHTDWSNKHFRFKDGGVSVIYDWDSLHMADELCSLGMACSTFTATWYFKTRIIPTPEESLGFVEEYQRHHGRTFSRPELDVISAHAANVITYIARCMHAANPKELYGSYFE
jgi:hypothetical protein